MQVDPSQELLKRLMMGGMGGGGMMPPDMSHTMPVPPPQQAIPPGQGPINVGGGAKFPFMQPPGSGPMPPMPVESPGGMMRPMPMPSPTVPGGGMVGGGNMPQPQGGGMMGRFKALAGAGPAIGNQMLNNQRRRPGMNYSR